MERTPRGVEQDKSSPDVELCLCIERHSSSALLEHRCEELTPYLTQQSVSNTQTLKYFRSARAQTQHSRSGEVRNKVSNIKMSCWPGYYWGTFDKTVSCLFKPVLHWHWTFYILFVDLVHHWLCLANVNVWFYVILQIWHQCFLTGEHRWGFFKIAKVVTVTRNAFPS